MLEFLKTNMLFFGAIFGGVFVSVFASEEHTLRQSIVRIICGLFCGVYFTEPLIFYASLTPEVYTNAVAGLLAITGYNVVKTISKTTLKDLVGYAKSFRGGKS